MGKKNSQRVIKTISSRNAKRILEGRRLKKRS
jgi:hypothetical protein